MSQDPRQLHEGLAQPQRRQVMLAVAAIAGLALTIKSPALIDAGADLVEAGSDLLGQMLQALGQEASVGVTNAAVELHLGRILRAPLATLAPDVSVLDLKDRIRRNIEADYRAGDIRVVNGWWLSATEANCLELIAQVSAG